MTSIADKINWETGTDAYAIAIIVVLVVGTIIANKIVNK